MTSTEGSFRLHKSVAYEEIRWEPVADVLANRFELSSGDAEELIGQFKLDLTKTLNIRWFRKPSLSASENMVVASLAECLGADMLTIILQRRVRLYFFPSDYTLALSLSPNLRVKKAAEYSEKESSVKAILEISLAGVTLRLRRRWEITALSYLLFTCAVFCTTLAFFFFFYGLSSFLLFLFLPAEVTVAATNHLLMFVSLVAFLMGTAAICGRGIGNALLKVWRTTFGRKKPIALRPAKEDEKESLDEAHEG